MFVHCCLKVLLNWSMSSFSMNTCGGKELYTHRNRGIEGSKVCTDIRYWLGKRDSGEYSTLISAIIGFM